MQRTALSILAALALTLGAVLAWLSLDPSPGVGAPDLRGAPPPDAGSEPVHQDEAQSVPALPTPSSAPSSAPSTLPRAPIAREPDPPAAAGADDEELELRAVRRQDRRPVAGADVVVVLAPDDPDGERTALSWIGSRELEQQVEGAAARAATDAAGRALLRRPPRAALAIASAGDLWGYRLVRESTAGPIEIELVRDFDLIVEVVDSSGRPAAGVPIVLRARFGDQHRDTLHARTQGPDGRAVLRHGGHRIGIDSGSRWAWMVAVAAALEHPVERKIDSPEPPASPFRLVLPPSGALEVHILDARGELFLEPLEVGLRVLPRGSDLEELGAGPRTHELSIHLLRGGLALFEHVEPDRAFEATVRRQGSRVDHRARGRGPPAAGESAVLAVHIGRHVPVIAGRALDSDGLVLAQADLRARIHPDEHPARNESTAELRTDAEGRFQVDVGEPWDPSSGRTLTVYAAGAYGEELRSATRALPAHLSPGENELGDFVLERPPLLASGTVVDEHGAPVGGAWVTPALKQLRNAADPERYGWQTLWMNRVQSDEEGRFELRTRLPAQELRLTAAGDDSMSAPVEVFVGASSVSLRLLSTGSIAGRVLLDPSVPRDALRLIALREGGGAHTSPAVTGARLEEGGRFAFQALQPGTYTVRVMPSALHGTVLHELEGVQVGAGAVARDPRLDPLDLRSELGCLVIEIVDEQERPIEKGSIRVRPSQDPRNARQDVPFVNGRAVLFSPTGAVDLIVGASGFRPVVLSGVTSSRRAVLRRGLDLRLVLADGQEAPEPPFFLGAALVPIREDGSLTHGLAQRSEASFGKDGALTMRAPAAGLLAVHFTLALRDRIGSSTSSILGKERQILEVAESEDLQTFEVHLDAAAYERARSQLARDI